MSNREKLADFLKALYDASIIDFNKKRFNHRLKLQKYVFIAGKFGFKTNYNYSLYIHGPYSSSLADDYYAITDFKDREPLELDSRFVELVKNKSEEWLELASTIMMIKRRYRDIDLNTLFDLVMTVKPFAKKESLIEINNHLDKCNA